MEKTVFAVLGCLGFVSRVVAATGGINVPAELEVTKDVLRPAEKVPPLGANYYGGDAAISWGANNFVHNPGNEPIYWRNLHRVKNCGENWFEIDGPGASWFQLWGSGLFSGANLRIYRIVDKAGNPLPLEERKNKTEYLNLEQADHVVFVGKAQVIPEGTKDFPDGGWIANKYAEVYPISAVRYGNLTVVDHTAGVENGRTYWYTVEAIASDPSVKKKDAKISSDSNEASATPQAGLATPPRVMAVEGDNEVEPHQAGKKHQFTAEAHGGQAPYQWEVVDKKGRPLTLPVGVQFDPATVTISWGADVKDFPLYLQAKDAKGQSDRRCFVVNPAPVADGGGKTRPEPPTELTAVAGDGCVLLSWKPSSSPDICYYLVKRSTAPAAKQEDRVYLSPGAPKLEKFDYVVLEKKFDPFDIMRGVNSRVRGMGNSPTAPNWYWRETSGKDGQDKHDLTFALAPHPKPVPADMVDPGETCLQVSTKKEGEQTIMQPVFCGTDEGKDSFWYEQLEPGKNYRLEVWLRQEGLADDGKVTFHYGHWSGNETQPVYGEIKATFPVTNEWKKYVYDFVGPERPAKCGIFGHAFTFRGPGMLWMDNARIFRWDRPEDKDKPYVPNATVLDELARSQPANGPKGVHRTWYLTRSAPMASILSWHANSMVLVDWRTRVQQTMDVTLPMGLSFDLATGKDPQSRMRPWLTIQHILHSEEEWLAFIEYLAAPYDPSRDTPASKPWAYKRYQQRGVGTPWTDEFSQITIEFGNETWHNGVFPDWLGFALNGEVHAGGREYGLFTRYLCETIMKSPYWKELQLDKKIRFALGANYTTIIKNDKVTGYGEEAIQGNPYANVLAHANYVGPKWETGEHSSTTFDDHGVQECLLSFIALNENARSGKNQVTMMEGHKLLEQQGFKYDLAAYEGGPSGYALPGQGSPAQVETNEKYGKSLAMAVGAFDAWMGSYAMGWTDQCFLAYGVGDYWHSHTLHSRGFQPHTAWLALMMRNLYASGDLMKVNEVAGPSIKQSQVKDDALYPLIGGYAMRDGNKWSVFVLSRKLDGSHDGYDFGDGFTPVTVKLPFSAAKKITLYKLTGDPRWSNREEQKVSIQTGEIPVNNLKNGAIAIDDQTGGGAKGMPPGSIFLYVFEDTSS